MHSVVGYCPHCGSPIYAPTYSDSSSPYLDTGGPL